jgi:hypothetical protein
MAFDASPSNDAAGRRGQPLSYVSYWSQQRRLVRKQIFELRERGFAVQAIARELDLSVHEVESTLLSDRRTRTRDIRPSAS